MPKPDQNRALYDESIKIDHDIPIPKQAGRPGAGRPRLGKVRINIMVRPEANRLMVAAAAEARMSKGELLELTFMQWLHRKSRRPVAGVSRENI